MSSLSEDPTRRVDPLPWTGPAAEALRQLADLLASMPRSRIVSRTDLTLHAEFRSRLGFVDDLDLAADVPAGIIHIRSASRTGQWDMGVNRRRVERIRRLWREHLEG